MGVDEAALAAALGPYYVDKQSPPLAQSRRRYHHATSKRARPDAAARIAVRGQLLELFVSSSPVNASDDVLQSTALRSTAALRLRDAIVRALTDSLADGLCQYAYASSTGLADFSIPAIDLLRLPSVQCLLSSLGQAQLSLLEGVAGAGLTRIVAAWARGDAPPIRGVEALCLFSSAPSSSVDSAALRSELRRGVAPTGDCDDTMDGQQADDGDEVGPAAEDASSSRLLSKALAWVAQVALPFSVAVLQTQSSATSTASGSDAADMPSSIVPAVVVPPHGCGLVYSGCTPVADASAADTPYRGPLHTAVSGRSSTTSSSVQLQLRSLLASLHRLAYSAVFKARCEVVFDLLRDFPESLSALVDLRDCLAELGPPACAQLVAALTSSLRTRLLHQGVGTASILELFITSVKALRVVDSSGAVLPPVLATVATYLRTRSDAVRVVVSSLVDDTDGALHAELAAKRPAGSFAAGGRALSSLVLAGSIGGASGGGASSAVYSLLVDAGEDDSWATYTAPIPALSSSSAASADGSDESVSPWPPSEGDEAALTSALCGPSNNAASIDSLPPHLRHRAAAAFLLGYEPRCGSGGGRDSSSSGFLNRHAFGAAAYPPGFTVVSPPHGHDVSDDEDANTFTDHSSSSSSAVTTALHFLLPRCLHAIPAVARPFPPIPPLTDTGAIVASSSGSTSGGAASRAQLLWRPAPREAAPGAAAALKSDFLSLLVSVFGSADAFANEYRSLLGERLLAKGVDDYDTSADERTLELLRLRFGDTPLLPAEIMLRDVADSKRVMKQITAQPAVGAGSAAASLLGKQLQSKLPSASASPTASVAAAAAAAAAVSAESVLIDATIVSHAYWPPFPRDAGAKGAAALHPSLSACAEAVAASYSDVRKPRHLELYPSLGTIVLEVEVPFSNQSSDGGGGGSDAMEVEDGGNSAVEVTCSPPQASVLLYLQEAPGQHLPLSSLARLLKLSPAKTLPLVAFWTAPDQHRLVTLAAAPAPAAPASAASGDHEVWLTAAMPASSASGGDDVGGAASAAATPSLAVSAATAASSGQQQEGADGEDDEAATVHESYILGALHNPTS